MTIGPTLSNVVQFYGQRIAGPQREPEPVAPQPAYDPILNPDRSIQTLEDPLRRVGRLVGERSPFFADMLQRYIVKYHGRLVYQQHAVVRAADGKTETRSSSRSTSSAVSDVIPRLVRRPVLARASPVSRPGPSCSRRAVRGRPVERASSRRPPSSTSWSSCRRTTPSTTTSGPTPGATGSRMACACRVTRSKPGAGCVEPYHLTLTSDDRPQSRRGDAAVAINGGEQDGFVAAQNQRNLPGDLAMGYYDGSDLPLLLEPAADYVLADRLLQLGHRRQQGEPHVLGGGSVAAADRRSPDWLHVRRRSSIGSRPRASTGSSTSRTTTRASTTGPSTGDAKDSQTVWVPLVGFPRSSTTPSSRADRRRQPVPHGPRAPGRCRPSPTSSRRATASIHPET